MDARVGIGFEDKGRKEEEWMRRLVYSFQDL